MSSSAEGITVGLEIPTDKQADTTAGSVTGVTGVTSGKRARKQDAPPKPRKTSAKRKPANTATSDVTTGAIEEALSMLLSLPAMPCSLVGDEWAEQHFMTQGPALAKQVAQQSERSPALRKWCEKLVGGEAVAALVMASFMYALPPMMHWGLLPVPDDAKALFGVPVVNVPDTATAAGGNGNNSSNGNLNGTGPITGAL